MPNKRNQPGRRRKRWLFVLICSSSAVLITLAAAANLYLNRPTPEPAEPQEQAVVLRPVPQQSPNRCSAAFFANRIKLDAAKYFVIDPGIDTLQQPLRGGSELKAPAVLKRGRGTVDTAHLRLSLSVAKIRSASDDTQGFRADTTILSITNKSDVPVAYRVVTRVAEPARCKLKADLPHNAVALRPHETIRRTECLFHEDQAIQVNEVDAYELTELGYYYLSRVQPELGGPFDMRVSGMHTAGKVAPCNLMPWHGLEGSPDEIWHALIDFHARHDCDQYSVPKGYVPWTRPGVLPECGQESGGASALQ